MESMVSFRRRLPGQLFADESILTVPFERTLNLSPRIIHSETPEAYVYKAQLPGLTRNDVKVEIEAGNVVCVKGEKKVEKEEKTDKFYRIERSSGMFLQRFRLPENSEPDLLDAAWDHGVLTLTVPKKESYHHGSHNNKTIQLN